MPCIICYPSEVADDAGFSALCVHPAAGCETSSQPSMMDLTCLLHSPAVDTAFAQGPGVTGVTEQLAETGT